MKAIQVSEPRGVAGLTLAQVGRPTLGPTELRVRVHASGLNRADLLQARGLYPAPPDAPLDLLGLEFAGEVVECGARARQFRIGDRVMGVVGGGAHAEEVVTPEREVLPIPEGWDYALAAAAPEAFLTAYDALVLQGGLRPSDSVLIHAVSGGVGSAASQLAAAFGAQVLGTGRSPEKLALCAEHYGLDVPITLGEDGAFASEVRRATDGRGVDLILDLVGGPTLAESVRCAATGARILQVGLLGGDRAELDLFALMKGRIRLVGTVLRGRPPEEKMALAQAARRELLPLWAGGILKPVLAARYPAEDWKQAFGALTRLTAPGKVVLTWR